jgi:signal peptidase I
MRTTTVTAVLGTSCLLAALAMAVLDVRVLAFRSGSMSPTISTGALALAREVPADQLRVGDVVSVLNSSEIRVTHRIAAIEMRGREASLELRGDANQVSDPAPYQVSSADRVFFSVPRLGYFAVAMVGPFGLVLMCLYALALMGIMFQRTNPAGRARRIVVGATVAAAMTGAAVPVAAGSSSTLAYWADSAATTGSTFSTGRVAAPPTFTCGGIGLFTVSFNWSLVPGATSYTLHYGSGGASTSTVTGTSSQVTSLVSGGTAWVVANQNFGSTTWTSAASNTRSYTVAIVSVCG